MQTHDGPRGGLSMSRHTLVCPRCGSEDVRRSRRRRVEHLVSWIGVLPYRCDACSRRFLSSRPPPPHDPPAHAPPPADRESTSP